MRQTLGTIGLVTLLSLAVTTSAVAEAESETATESEASSESREVARHSEADGSGDGETLFRIFGVGMMAASAGDLATTEYGLSRGFYETNPLVTNRNVRVATHVLVPAVVLYSTKKMREKGHHKMALWTRIAVTAAYGYAVMHNLRQVNRP